VREFLDVDGLDPRRSDWRLHLGRMPLEAASRHPAARHPLRTKGQAEATYNANVVASLTPTLIQKQYLVRWNGQLPQYTRRGKQRRLPAAARRTPEVSAESARETRWGDRAMGHPVGRAPAPEFRSYTGKGEPWLEE
jgi:hypothetical protein